MRGKVLTRLAAGTCSICICYALTMQSIRGEPVTPEWSDRYALTVETAARTPEQTEPLFAEQQGDLFFDPSYEHRRNGKKSGRRGMGTFSASEREDSPEEEKRAAKKRRAKKQTHLYRSRYPAIRRRFHSFYRPCDAAAADTTAVC